jgi:hypothetical protein
VESTSGELSITRGTNTPDEDHGIAVRNAAGRGSHGIRLVSGSVSMHACYETLPHLLQMALGTSTASGSAAPYTHVIERDTTAKTSKSYTWEVNDDTQDWIGSGIEIPSWELSYDALAAGENSPWMFTAELQGSKLVTGTATAAQAVPASETMEGHLTTLSTGTTGTAFASLTALTGRLVNLSISGEDPKPPRPYGSAADLYTVSGRRKGVCTVTGALLLDSTSLGATFTIHDVAGSVPTERRMRVTIAGTGTHNDATIDFRILFTDVHVEADGRDGERLFSFTGETVYDSTLTTDILVSIVNAVASY